MTVNIHFLSAMKKCQEEKYEEAIPLFTQSLSLEPQHPESFFNRGLARFKLGHYQKAIQDYDEAINLSPYQAELYSERGVARHLSQDNRGALEDLNRALELDPQNPYRYSSRAYVRAFIGDTLGAIEDYKIAIVLDPEDAVAYNNLGLLEEKLGYKTSAHERFERADALADAGKTFEKPDLEDILKKYEARQKAQAETRKIHQRQDNIDLSSSSKSFFSPLSGGGPTGV
ncbi:MAG: tetratricopeptide repeat protein [Bacteroidia bacterium]|nr:tetratricopeptide repeat protein [Bacteroidia bacterium]